MKILALDLETSPNLAYVWGLWQQNVSLPQLQEVGEVICFGAQWLGSKEVIFKSVYHDGKQAMLEEVHRLLDEADALMGWNSKGFDAKHLMREFLLAGMEPPSPFQHIDLMLEVKSTFRFTSNKLDHVSQQLGVGQKVKHQGFQLWMDCMNGDDATKSAAWATMKKYQIQDVLLLPKIYGRLQPYLKRHPNHALIGGDLSACPTCGGTKLQSRGFAVTGTARYRRYQCQSCSKWLRSARSEATSEFRSIA